MIEWFQKVFELRDFKTAYDKISIDDYNNLKIDLRTKYIRYILE